MSHTHTEGIDCLKEDPDNFYWVIKKMLKQQAKDQKWKIYIAEKDGEEGIGVLRLGEKAGEWFPSFGPIAGEIMTKEVKRPPKHEMNMFKNCQSFYVAVKLAFETCMYTVKLKECFNEEATKNRHKCYELEKENESLKNSIKSLEEEKERLKEKNKSNGVSFELWKEAYDELENEDAIIPRNNANEETKPKRGQKKITGKDAGADGPGIPDNDVDLQIEIQKFLKSIG